MSMSRKDNNYDDYHLDIDDEEDNDELEENNYLNGYYYNDNNQNDNFNNNTYYNNGFITDNKNNDSYYDNNVNNNNSNNNNNNNYYGNNNNNYYGDNSNYYGNNNSSNNNYYSNNSSNDKVGKNKDSKNKDANDFKESYYGNGGNSYYGNNNSYYSNSSNYYNSNNQQPVNYYGKYGLQNKNNQAKDSKNKKGSQKKKNKSVNDKLFIIIIVILVIGIVVLLTYVLMSYLKSYEIAFELNGSLNIQDAPIKCQSNILGHCYVTLPNATREKGEVVGYSLSANSLNAEYKMGEEIELFEDTILYVISKEDYKIDINTSDIDEIDNSNVTCSAYNKEKSCDVTLPGFNKKGYLNIGYSKEQKDTKTTIRAGDTITLTDNLNYYPVYADYHISSRGVHINNINSTVKLNKGYIDIASSCSSSIVDKAVEYIKTIENKYPAIIKYNKVTLLGQNDFYHNTGMNSNVKGITFYSLLDNVPSVFISCEDEDLDLYVVIFHELMHVFDMRAGKILGTDLSKDTEITNSMKARGSARVLRDYAYTQKEEFFAELLTTYYFSYIETNYQVKDAKTFRITLPDNLKKLAEKYFCILNNNYDNSKC